MRATFLLIAVVSVTAQQVNTKGCDDSNEKLAKICYELYKTMQHSLYNDGGNLYRLRKAYFYAPNANPILLRVVYNIAISNFENSSLPICTEDAITTSNQTTFIAGWTSSGVFTIFDPMTINFMQMQLPFAVMRFCYVTMKNDSPEANTFLWDGSYDLPTLHLNLHIDHDSLSCVPSHDIFESVLMDFTSMLRVYAGNHKDGILHDSDNIPYVGFSLPESSVSRHQVYNRLFGTAFHWLYVPATTTFLFALCHFIAQFLISKSSVTSVSNFFENHREFIVGPIIAMLPFLFFEFLMEIIMASIWCKNNPLTCPVIWVSELIYFIPDIITVVVLVYKYRDSLKTRCHNLTASLSYNYEQYHNLFVWISALFGYHIMYSFFPLFILAFAYPTKIISMIIFFIAFMVSFTTFIIIFVHICLKKDTERVKSAILGLLFMGFLLYFYGVLVALTYALVVGKASVVSSAPLALLSIIPSLIIGSILWVLKNVVFGKSDNASDSVNNGDLELHENDGHVDRGLKDYGACAPTTPSEESNLINGTN